MYRELVNEFHQAVQDKTGVQTLGHEFVAGDSVASFRAGLIGEECDEVIDSLNNDTKAEVLKELCDLLYVVFGTAITFDLPIEEAFQAVHENNMLKIKNGVLGPTGKWIKDKNHPKCNLSKLIAVNDGLPTDDFRD